MWVGYSVLFAVFALLDATVWQALPLVVVLVALVAAASAGGAVLYWHTTLRGKFLLWQELLDAVPRDEPQQVLDLGCGRAAVTVMVALRLPLSTVTGIDLWRSVDQSGNSIDAARRNTEHNDVAKRVHLDTGDMTALPYPDGGFDLITASLSIHNITTRQGRRRALEEAVRVLAPDGRMIIVDIRRIDEYSRELARLGLHVGAPRPAGWRCWWSGPWMATTVLEATRPR
jgi:SAM-dependent methyltransferase